MPPNSDEAILGASDTFDFNALDFVGPSTTNFLMGTIDTDMNFDWVSSPRQSDLNGLGTC